MQKLTLLTGILLLAATATTARAHFVWVLLESDGQGQPTANAFFGEGPTPGEDYLIEKIASTKAWFRTADGKSTTVDKWTVKKSGESGRLTAPVQANGAGSLEAVCDYGVLNKGGSTFRLKYYAKNIAPGDAAGLDALGRAERLTLDVVPRLTDDGLTLTVLYDGKPVPEAEIVVGDSHGNEHELKTDKRGQVTVESPEPALYRARAAYVDETAGEQNGKKYPQTRHYSTLTLALPLAGDKKPAQKLASEGPSASGLLARSREARVVWNEFPGFTADVVLRMDSKTEKTRLEITPDGEAKLQIDDPELARWARWQLGSMMSHRMPDGSLTSEADFADDDLGHLLGRRIELEDPGMGSVYRINGDVVSEVNRNTGPTRFTISMLDVTRNAEDKYLPHVYTVSIWEKDSGRLKSTASVINDWKRVGAYDLPTRLMEVFAADGTRSVRQIEFSNHKLGAPRTAQAE